MESLIKDLLFKMGIYKYAKRYLLKPYNELRGTLFKFSAKKAIRKVMNIMNEHSYRYWLEFGTLLGAVREKGFISHDCDIDIAMDIDDRNSNLARVLQSNGFKLKKRAKLLSGEIIEETYFYKFAQIDFFYAYKSAGQITIYDYQTMDNLSPNECIKKYGGLRVHENTFAEFGLVKYELFGTETWIPENYQFHLQQVYGSDFMIKNKNWNSDSVDFRKKTNQLAIVEYL